MWVCVCLWLIKSSGRKRCVPGFGFDKDALDLGVGLFDVTIQSGNRFFNIAD